MERICIIMNNFLTDRIYRVARLWSNKELRKFAHLFKGDIVNVSGWKDIDKEGNCYKDYFSSADNYFISNYKSEAKGLQGFKNEFFLDLEEPLDLKYLNKFDVVFNHTTLEHIYEVRTAFKNLCSLSNDIVIVVVPFLQQMHGDYGDYWRFTPLTIKQLFEENGFELLYLSFNNHKHASVYIFAIGSKQSQKWSNYIKNTFTYSCNNDYRNMSENYIGCKAITNKFIYKLSTLIKNNYESNKKD